MKAWTLGRCRIPRMRNCAAMSLPIYFHVAHRITILLLTMAAPSIAQSGRFEAIAISGVSDVPGVTDAKFQGFSPPAIDAKGHVAFSAGLEVGPGGVTRDNLGGIWAADKSGSIALVARTGVGSVPGVPGANFVAFSPQVGQRPFAFSPEGYLAFRGQLETGVGDVTSLNNRGIWKTGDDTSLSLLTRQGDDVPGVPDAHFVSFESSFGLSGNHLLFYAEIGGSSVTSSTKGTLWKTANEDVLEMIAREGISIPPGVPYNTTLLSLGSSKINSSGAVIFQGRLAGLPTNADSGIWVSAASGDISLFAIEGVSNVPGAPGAMFSGFSTTGFNSLGSIAFNGTLQAGVGGVLTTNDQGAWGPAMNGATALLLREHSGGVPGLPGASFSRAGLTLLNEAGETAFTTSLLVGGGGGVIAGTDRGIWGPDPNGNLTMIARRGIGGVPNLPGVDFTSFHDPSLNNNGNTVFRAGWGNIPNNTGIWISDGLDLVEVTRDGQQLPGMGAEDLDMLDGATGTEGNSTALNDWGQVAFQAYEAVEGGVRTGIFVWTPDLHWRGTAQDERWSSRTNWTLSLSPAMVHRVWFDPSGDTSLQGPEGDTAIKSMVIGGGSGTARLVLESQSRLTVEDGVVIGDKGVLSGSGTVAAPVDIAAGGTLAPGESIGRLLLGSLRFASESTCSMEIDPLADTSDMIEVSGSVELDGTALRLKVLNAPSVAEAITFLLIQNDAEDSVIGTFGSVQLEGVPLIDYAIDYGFNGEAINGTGDGNDIAVVLTFVPEPAGPLFGLWLMALRLGRRVNRSRLHRSRSLNIGFPKRIATASFRVCVLQSHHAQPPD